jgi:hypothetical protein
MSDQSLALAWGKALTLERDDSGLALVARRRFRVHVGRLLSAVWATVKAVGSAHELAIGNPLAMLKVGAESFGALIAALQAFQEPLSAIEFMTCVALKSEEHGMTPTDLKKQVDFLCEKVPPELFPWWLGIDAKLLTKARSGITPPNTFDGVLSALRKSNLITDGSEGKVILVDRELVWQLQ